MAGYQTTRPRRRSCARERKKGIVARQHITLRLLVPGEPAWGKLKYIAPRASAMVVLYSEEETGRHGIRMSSDNEIFPPLFRRSARRHML